jgi:DNA-binding IclR family transcriptional regulator
LSIVAKGRIAGTQVIHRASRLLKAFTLRHPQMSLANLAQKVDLPAPTAYRILQALVNEGFLTQDPKTSEYSLGAGLVRLGELAQQTVDLCQIAVPHAERVAALWGETTNIDLLDSNRQVATILHIPAVFHLATGTHHDRPLPPHCTSTGKVMLAYVAKPRLDQILSRQLEAFTSKTITDPEALLQELDRIRAQGYATNLEELEDDLVAVGAPIRNVRGQVIAAISVGGPMKRIGPERVPKIAESVIQAAQGISADLGYDPGPETTV